ncbi:hypothetical protein GCM10025759_30680 [Lysobacter panacisoli]|uniref:Uncharacterized protein n=1 Tax=Lysobacter panacisoli TaxID=1255263 RepID=A0ABP9LRR4_9GAMM
MRTYGSVRRVPSTGPGTVAATGAAVTGNDSLATGALGVSARGASCGARLQAAASKVNVRQDRTWNRDMTPTSLAEDARIEWIRERVVKRRPPE